MHTEPKKVMVVGGGIAGLTTAWELARQGVKVDLVEKAGFLGGHAIQYCCKAADECLRCSACNVDKMLRQVVATDDVSIYLNAEVAGIEKNGKFNVKLKTAEKNGADADNPDKALGCMVQNGFARQNQALAKNSAALPAALDADAVVLATGFKPFDAAIKQTYGYGQFDNVVTGLEMERLKRAHGQVVRPSDKKPPRSVAFIQCVGSRDERLGNLWCSQVCCSYALRSAKSLKHALPDTEITIFYMDIQNTNKDFNAFYEQCREEFRFIRNIPVDVYPEADGAVRMRYVVEEDGRPVDENFDLLVLSVGIMPGADNTRLADQFGVGVNSDGFLQSQGWCNKSATAVPGVFVAGTVEGPKTIAASMAHAGEAVDQVTTFLGEGN